jgi:ADP-ribose pyrophosphatase YjhB (NUDIX family)
MELPALKHFNIRVYGLLINEKMQILLTDEYMLNRKMTKFPGGGMHFGEGPEDCLKREAREEFGQEIEIIGHFYTTGFFQRALFYEDHQLISIYYRIRFFDPPRFKISRTF